MNATEFEALVRRHDPRLRALAYRLLGDRSRLDDALQEAYVKAYRAQSSFQGYADPGTWLYRIVYNTCLDELRRLGRRRTDELREHDVPANALSVEDRLSERSRLASAFDGLTEEQKAVVWLVDVEGFDYAAVGEVLGIRTGTVSSRLSRAHSALRRRLGELEEEER